MRTTQPPEDFSALRTVVAKMIPTHARRQWAYESGSSSQASSNAGSGRTSPRPNGEGHRLTLAEKRQRHELRSLELELLADAFEAHDPHVHMDDGDIVRADVEVYGPDAPVASLKDLERILEKRKRGRRPTWVGLRPGPPSSFPSVSKKSCHFPSIVKSQANENLRRNRTKAPIGRCLHNRLPCCVRHLTHPRWRRCPHPMYSDPARQCVPQANLGLDLTFPVWSTCTTRWRAQCKSLCHSMRIALVCCSEDSSWVRTFDCAIGLFLVTDLDISPYAET